MKEEQMKLKLLELFLKIQKNPEDFDLLIDELDFEDDSVTYFLRSIRGQPAYLIPSLIEVFANKYRGTEPTHLKHLMQSRHYVGSMFSDMDGVGWTYLGISTNGMASCRPDNSSIVQELDPDLEIRWVF